MNDLSPDSLQLLKDGASGDEPTEDDFVRIRSKLAVRLGTAAVLGAGTLAATTSAAEAAVATSGAAKGAAAVAGTSIAPAAIVTGGTAGAAGTTATVATSAIGTSLVTKILVGVALVGGAVGGGSVATRGKPVAHIEVQVPAVPTPSVVNVEKANSNESANAAPSAPGLAQKVDVPPIEPGNSVPKKAVEPTRPVVATEAREMTSRPGSDGLDEELVLMKKAQSNLARGDGAGALASLAEHAQRFPKGMLREERAATVVLAMCASGRVSEARDAALRFERAYPQSALLGRVRQSCVRENP